MQPIEKNGAGEEDRTLDIHLGNSGAALCQPHSI